MEVLLYTDFKIRMPALNIRPPPFKAAMALDIIVTYSYHCSWLISESSPSSWEIMSPPTSAVPWASSKTAWKFTFAIARMKPWSIPRLCQLMSAT